MATIKEDYVSFEIAKLLKEKGFDEMCQKVYMHNGRLLWAQIFMEGETLVNNKCIEAVANYNGWITHIQGEYAYLCPALQMAMKWLREIHKILILVEYDCPVFSSDIYKMDDIDEYGSAKHVPPTFANCKSYEEACEAALKYCLENLI